MDQKVVTRFAPSPTGYMHVGGARTALFAWAFARKNKGTFILRIEDTDKKREVEGSIQQIMDSLKWLGIDWDEGPDIGGPNAPYLQSQRLSSYKEYASKLADSGLAYADPYTPEELDSFRKKAEEEKRAFHYRDHRPENPPVWDGTQPLRLRIKDIKESHWHDCVRGDLSAGPDALDDFILMKADGYPTYNFAHIIDDLHMNTTHIFRADEFLSSVPNYLALYEALGIKPPQFVTLPPIMGPDGKKKLSKRDGAKDLLDYKAEGFLSEAVMNFLAFIGWNPGDEREVMRPQDIIEAFDISKIQPSGGKLNEEKLLWLNKEHIKLLPPEVVAQSIRERIPEGLRQNPMTDKIVPLIIERINTWGDVKSLFDQGEFGFFYEAPNYKKESLICEAKMRKGIEVSNLDIDAHLREVIKLLEPVESFDYDTIKNSVWQYATDKGRGVVLWAVRYALSGREKSPDPFLLASILGKDETIKRLNNAIHKS